MCDVVIVACFGDLEREFVQTVEQTGISICLLKFIYGKILICTVIVLLLCCLLLRQIEIALEIIVYNWQQKSSF